jgi:tRNA nucleotidyltransferase (CCA-adding enzyme)
MCARLGIPNRYRQVGMAAAKEHLNIHRFNDLKPIKKVRLLMRLRVIQDDLLARRVVMASKADARGRGPLHENNPYPQGDRVLEAIPIIKDVRGNEFAHIKNGEKIARRMEQERSKALKTAGF